MFLFSRRKELEVQSLMLRLVNSHSAERGQSDGPRVESRVNLSLVVQVVPCQNGVPQLERAFAAVTKEVATTGASLILPNATPMEEVIFGFRWENEMKYVRAQAVHLSPMGGGFYQLGLKLKSVVRPSDYPGLEQLTV